MSTYRIVKDGITPGCPIYRIDKKHFGYWSIGAEDFMPDYRTYSITEAIVKIKAKEPKSKIYLLVDDYLQEQIFSIEEHVGVKESPLKTFPRVNDFEVGSSYRY